MNHAYNVPQNEYDPEKILEEQQRFSSEMQRAPLSSTPANKPRDSNFSVDQDIGEESDDGVDRDNYAYESEDEDELGNADVRSCRQHADEAEEISGVSLLDATVLEMADENEISTSTTTITNPESDLPPPPQFGDSQAPNVADPVTELEPPSKLGDDGEPQDTPDGPSRPLPIIRLDKGAKSSRKRKRNQMEKHPMIEPPCSCKKNCPGKFTEDVRRGIHTKYW